MALHQQAKRMKTDISILKYPVVLIGKKYVTLPVPCVNRSEGDSKNIIDNTNT